jgi:hypothetical protein
MTTMIKLRHQQPSLWHRGLAEDIGGLWEPWMRLVDELLEDEQLLDTVYEARGERHPQSRSRGRMQTPAEVLLRLLADPTMSEATAILQSFSCRLKQLHVSDVNSQSKHDPLSLESMLAFQRVSRLVPPEIPIIMESRVDEAHICEELERAVESLTPNAVLAITGD